MVDFLAENNACGQTLLRLVSRGNAILAELLRLSDFIPPVFKHDQQNKYSELVYDFRYFRSAEAYESNIQTQPVCASISTQKYNTENLYFLTFKSSGNTTEFCIVVEWMVQTDFFTKTDQNCYKCYILLVARISIT